MDEYAKGRGGCVGGLGHELRPPPFPSNRRWDDCGGRTVAPPATAAIEVSDRPNQHQRKKKVDGATPASELVAQRSKVALQRCDAVGGRGTD